MKWRYPVVFTRYTDGTWAFNVSLLGRRLKFHLWISNGAVARPASEIVS